MSVIRLDSKAAGAAFEQGEPKSNSVRPDFDVIGLLKEGSKSAGFFGKGTVDRLVSTPAAPESVGSVGKGTGEGLVSTPARADSAGLFGKGNVEGLVSTPAASANPVSDLPNVSNPEAAVTNVNSGYKSVEENECDGDVGFTLLVPAGTAGMMLGGKLGVEAGFALGGPAGAATGGIVGMGIGTIAGAGVAFYSADKACGWMQNEVDKENASQYNS